ncbi:chlorophyll a-b binding CP24 10A, chloroplastic [Olea europaea subsp. europaea]|uniref:Chlorophyll a-b binding protein, chloroplastic n=1 Tax=Olea europaea subsp. europaea TaxID=158383 RepID=A0A8S0PAX7_OLEEU|nr:chlorophyll a-b binding CP24 10A, chloroplastic [Olea europaea subsp. europaea]
MVLTSFALVNGFGFSAFLNGGKNSHILLFAPIAARTGGSALSPKRLPGDYGFNPLGLGKDLAFLNWYREAELIHGRWAMAAIMGIFVGQAWSGIPGLKLEQH